MYVYMYVNLFYSSICVCMNTCMYVCVFTRVYMCKRMYVSMYVRMYIRMCDLCVYTYVCPVYMYICFLVSSSVCFCVSQNARVISIVTIMCTYMHMMQGLFRLLPSRVHTYIHTYVHTYIHTYI